MIAYIYKSLLIIPSMRKLICGNWKMNCTIKTFEGFDTRIKAAESADIDILVAVPYLYLPICKDNFFQPCAQDVSEYDCGAYTGDVSAKMLKDVGVSYSIVGHSERHEYFGETCEKVNKKLKHLIKYSIEPIMCIGESLEHRENNTHKQFIENQMNKCLEGIKNTKINIAYEPIWAIGSGNIASEDQIADMIDKIKEEMEVRDVSGRILYGGSVNSKNIAELARIKNLDGVLVGNASLNFNEFVKIINIFLSNH